MLQNRLGTTSWQVSERAASSGCWGREGRGEGELAPRPVTWTHTCSTMHRHTQFPELGALVSLANQHCTATCVMLVPLPPKYQSSCHSGEMPTRRMWCYSPVSMTTTMPAIHSPTHCSAFEESPCATPSRPLPLTASRTDLRTALLDTTCVVVTPLLPSARCEVVAYGKLDVDSECGSSPPATSATTSPQHPAISIFIHFLPFPFFFSHGCLSLALSCAVGSNAPAGPPLEEPSSC